MGFGDGADVEERERNHAIEIAWDSGLADGAESLAGWWTREIMIIQDPSSPSATGFVQLVGLTESEY